MSRSLSRLDELRSRLDEINLQLLNLMSKRGAIVKEIGEIKKKQGVQKFDPVREREMLDQLVKHNTGPFDDETIHLLSNLQGVPRTAAGRSQKDPARQPKGSSPGYGGHDRGRSCRQSSESRRRRSLFGGIGGAGPQSGRCLAARVAPLAGRRF